MTSLRQLQNLACINCGPALHNERGCVGCKSPHPTVSVKAYENPRAAVLSANLAKARQARLNKTPLSNNSNAVKMRAWRLRQRVAL